MNMRMESDSIGTHKIPAGAYYGIHSLRARENFPITSTTLHPRLIHNLALIKKAAARVNEQAGQLSTQRADAICAACDEVLTGKWNHAFIVDAIQGGAGTSANMNANEVIANRAIELLGGCKGDYRTIHPNDHVNLAQSTNDVFPTAGRLAMLDLIEPLLAQLRRLQEVLQHKEEQFDPILKLGRTQLQDAVPMRLGQTFGAWASVVGRDIRRLAQSRAALYSVNLGGTAIGSCINASPYYTAHIVPMLAQLSGYPLRQAPDLFDATEHLDCFVSLSGVLKTCAVDLSKICNDLRLLASGPRTGLGELELPARQNGSSIMPGKVNPVIPEVVNQAAFLAIGNDTTVTLAAEAGQLELNAFEPVVFFTLFQSLGALTGAVSTLREHCIEGIRANEERCRSLLENSLGAATALAPCLGYQAAANVAKHALRSGQSLRETVLEEHLLSPAALDPLLDPAALAGPPSGKHQPAV